MKSWRENPESEENQRATKQSEREVFALKMQAKGNLDYCPVCEMVSSQCECWDSINQTN